MIALRKYLAQLPGHYAAMVLLTVGGLLLTTPASGAAREPVRGRSGMVVSAHSLASQAGLDMLKQGGNAVDAAVTVGLALAVVHPSAGNLGGGGFMLVYTKDGQVTSFDFRETAPQAATEKMFLGLDGQYQKDSNSEICWPRPCAAPATWAIRTSIRNCRWRG